MKPAPSEMNSTATANNVNVVVPVKARVRFATGVGVAVLAAGWVLSPALRFGTSTPGSTVTEITGPAQRVGPLVGEFRNLLLWLREDAVK